MANVYLNRRTQPIITAKSVGLAVLLSILISGLGQIYLGRIGRGTAILIIGFGMSFGLTYFIGLYGILPILAFWIWQIYDSYKIAKQSQVPSAQPEKDFSKDS